MNVHSVDCCLYVNVLGMQMMHAESERVNFYTARGDKHDMRAPLLEERRRGDSDRASVTDRDVSLERSHSFLMS